MKLTVMQAALVAGIDVMRDRIERAVARNETWIYTLEHKIIDGVDVEDVIKLTFNKSEFSGYWLQISAHYVEGNVGPLDSFSLHVSSESILVVLNNDNNINGVDSFFDPIDDVAIVLDAIAHFHDMPDKLEEIIKKVEADRAEAAEYQKRRARFTVIDNPNLVK